MKKKEKKKSEPLRRRFRFSRTDIYLCGAALLIIVAILTGVFSGKRKESAKVLIPEPSKQPVMRITEKDHVMSLDAAYEYGKTVIGPVLDKYIKDGGEIPALRIRLIRIAEMLGAGTMYYRTVPAHYPRSNSLLLKSDLDPHDDKPVVYLFVPAVQKMEKEKSRKDFEDAIAVSFAHEYIHWENRYEFPWEKRRYVRDYDWEMMAEEAAAFGITIIEIIRPMESQGRRPFPELIASSEELRKVGDDYRRPGWIEAFRHYAGH